MILDRRESAIFARRARRQSAESRPGCLAATLAPGVNALAATQIVEVTNSTLGASAQ